METVRFRFFDFIDGGFERRVLLIHELVGDHREGKLASVVDFRHDFDVALEALADALAYGQSHSVAVSVEVLAVGVGRLGEGFEDFALFFPGHADALVLDGDFKFKFLGVRVIGGHFNGYFDLSA